MFSLFLRMLATLSLSVLLSVSAVAASTANSNWYDQDIWTNQDRAFQWYPDDKPRRQTKKPQAAPVPNPLVAFEMLQKELDAARKTAIMQPTEQNLKRYIALQEVVMNKSATFTDQWQRVIWQNPQLDYSQHSRPNNKLAMQVYDTQRQQQKVAAIKQLAGSNGILFVFRSDCPYCHAMAPIMKDFATLYGVKVMPVSLDGRGIPHFPRALPNNGIAQRLHVQSVPAIYIMDTKTKQFKPLGFGVMSQATLEDRFLVYAKPVGSVY